MRVMAFARLVMGVFVVAVVLLLTCQRWGAFGAAMSAGSLYWAGQVERLGVLLGR